MVLYDVISNYQLKPTLVRGVLQEILSNSSKIAEVLKIMQELGETGKEEHFENEMDHCLDELGLLLNEVPGWMIISLAYIYFAIWNAHDWYTDIFADLLIFCLSQVRKLNVHLSGGSFTNEFLEVRFISFFDMSGEHVPTKGVEWSSWELFMICSNVFIWQKIFAYLEGDLTGCHLMGAGLQISPHYYAIKSRVRSHKYCWFSFSVRLHPSFSNSFLLYLPYR